MANQIDFTFSDLVAGYVTYYDASKDAFGLNTSDGREYEVNFSPNVYGEVIRNLGEDFKSVGEMREMREMLTPGRYLYAYGVFYPDGTDGQYVFDAKHLVFTGYGDKEYDFEKQNWWINQIRELGDFYLKAQFGDKEIDYKNYSTTLNITGEHGAFGRQETDTISRLVYGFASAYLITGDERYLEAATKGTDYLRDHVKFDVHGDDTCFWYHAVDRKPDGTEEKILTSEFGDDYQAIPAYEQIYALAGPVQTFRATGDPRIRADADSTIKLFDKYFLDKSEKGGYYSHIDPVMFSAHEESLGANRARKNWNSVGDHAPAYLINLWLATGADEHADFLEYTFDTIAKHFPDYEESDFVQEKFHDDWSKDQTWGWQQNRAVVGHNLKIAWNLMRMNSLRSKDEYVKLAREIADRMPAAGGDQQRGGWYDVVDRVKDPEQKFYRYAWHDRKAWWQQEQGILAYQILAGVLGDEEYLRLARESAAFYNAWFLDTADGGIYFNVLANGHPFALGTERGKGSHSMSGYHSFELAYLAAIYNNLLISKEPMDFFFKPRPDASRMLRVQPDILPIGSISISEVWINNEAYENFDAQGLIVTLPESEEALKVRVRLIPAGVKFTANLMQTVNGSAKIALIGSLERDGIKKFQEQLRMARDKQIRKIDLDVHDLEYIAPEGIRFLAFAQQRLHVDFDIAVQGAKGQVLEALELSGLDEEISW